MCPKQDSNLGLSMSHRLNYEASGCLNHLTTTAGFLSPLDNFNCLFLIYLWAHYCIGYWQNMTKKCLNVKSTHFCC